MNRLKQRIHRLELRYEPAREEPEPISEEHAAVRAAKLEVGEKMHDGALGREEALDCFLDLDELDYRLANNLELHGDLPALLHRVLAGRCS